MVDLISHMMPMMLMLRTVSKALLPSISHLRSTVPASMLLLQQGRTRASLLMHLGSCPGTPLSMHFLAGHVLVASACTSKDAWLLEAQLCGCRADFWT